MSYDSNTNQITRVYRFETAVDAEDGDQISQVQHDVALDEVITDVNEMALDLLNDISEFNALYLGAFATDPVLDNDGNALVVGQLYVNSSVPELRFYSGAAWVPAAQSSIIIDNFVGDGVTTSFAINGTPMNEKALFIYIDGIYQNKDSFALSGNNVFFSETPPLLADIEILALSTSAIGVTTAELVTKDGGGTVQDFIDAAGYNTFTIGTVALLEANTSLSYTAGAGLVIVEAGDYVHAIEGSHVYKVLVSGGSGDITNSNGTPVQLQAIGENVLYRKGKYDYHLITGAIYNNAGTWELVQDGSHEPINVDSVTVVGDELVINYASVGATKVVSFLVGPDERFSQAGIIAGASVSSTEARVRIGAPLNFSIDMDNGVVTTQDWWAGSVTAAFADTYMEITHPSVYVDINLTVDQIQSVDALYVRNSQTREATTRTRIWPRTDIYGYLSYDGAAWSETNINTQFQGAISTNFTGGELVVSHPTNGADKSLSITGRHPYQAMSDSFGSTSFNVRFVNANTGADVTVEDTNMRFQFERKNVKCINAGVKDISMGEWAFKAPMAWIPDPTLLDIALANFFFVGVMEVDTTL